MPGNKNEWKFTYNGTETRKESGSALYFNAIQVKKDETNFFFPSNPVKQDQSILIPLIQEAYQESELLLTQSPYSFYEGYSRVPDLGALYGISPTHSSDLQISQEDYEFIQQFIGGTSLSPSDIGELNESSKGSMVYYYKAVDAAEALGTSYFGLPSDQTKLFQKYEDVLLELGYQKESRQSVDGKYRTYYMGYGYSILLDINQSTIPSRYSSGMPGAHDEITVHIEPVK